MVIPNLNWDQYTQYRNHLGSSIRHHMSTRSYRHNSKVGMTTLSRMEPSHIYRTTQTHIDPGCQIIMEQHRTPITNPQQTVDRQRKPYRYTHRYTSTDSRIRMYYPHSTCSLKDTIIINQSILTKGNVDEKTAYEYFSLTSKKQKQKAKKQKIRHITHTIKVRGQSPDSTHRIWHFTKKRQRNNGSDKRTTNPKKSRVKKHAIYLNITNDTSKLPTTSNQPRRFKLIIARRVGCLTQPAISGSSSISRERLLFNTHSKPIKCDFEFRFCQKCYKPPQNIKSGFSRQEKNRVIHSTQPNVQTAKNIEVTSSTTKKVQILTKYNKCTLSKVRISVSSPKYIQRTLTKVQISVSSSKYIQRTLIKVQISVSSSKYSQRTLSKVQISVSSSREHSMIGKSRSPTTGISTSYNKAVIVNRTETKNISIENDLYLCRAEHSHKHTPYGPYNLPHMVLCTKQGPDNA